MVMNPFVGKKMSRFIEALNKDDGMIYIIRSILAAPLLLLALLASSLIAAASDAVCYDTHRSLAFDDACDRVRFS